MGKCKACNTQNSDDSKFCKMCGFELEPSSPSTIHVKPEEIDGLLTDGYRLVSESNIEEAEFIVDAILQIDPENSSALALKATIHEKNGDLASAIECYEKVVALNPDSTLDRIKLAHLVKKAAAEPTPEELEVRSKNWLAIASAAAAVIVVTGVGIGLALNSKPKPSDERLVASNEATGFNFNPPATTGIESIPRPDLTNPLEMPSIPTESPVPTGRVPAPIFNPGPGLSGTTSNPIATGPLPLDNNIVWRESSATSGFSNPGPLLPDPSNQVSGSGVRQDPPVTATRPEDNILPPRENPKPQNRIEIRMNGGGESNPPSTIDREAESANIYRVARQKMSAGDYRGAIRDFQAALSGSGNPAQIHQFLGQCYKAIGENGSARNHYEQAIRLYEAAGNSSAAEACRQALRTLG